MKYRYHFLILLLIPLGVTTCNPSQDSFENQSVKTKTVIVTGNDYLTHLESEQSLSGFRMISTVDGGYIITGSISNDDRISQNVNEENSLIKNYPFLIKLDENFQIEWRKIIYDLPNGIGTDIIQNPNGSYSGVGLIEEYDDQFYKNYDMDLILFTVESNGDISHQDKMGGDYVDRYQRIYQEIVDDNHIVILCGETYSWGEGSGDILFQFGDINDPENIGVLTLGSEGKDTFGGLIVDQNRIYLYGTQNNQLHQYVLNSDGEHIGDNRLPYQGRVMDVVSTDDQRILLVEEKKDKESPFTPILLITNHDFEVENIVNLSNEYKHGYVHRLVRFNDLFLVGGSVIDDSGNYRSRLTCVHSSGLVLWDRVFELGESGEIHDVYPLSYDKFITLGSSSTDGKTDTYLMVVDNRGNLIRF